MYIMYCGESGLVSYLMFSQEGVPQAHQSKILSNTGIHWSSAGRISSVIFSEPPIDPWKTCLFGCWCILGLCSNTTKVRWESNKYACIQKLGVYYVPKIRRSVQAALSHRRKPSGHF